MKFVFSIFLVMSFSLHARELVIINFSAQSKEDAKLVKSALINQLSLPESFIKMRESQCQEVGQAIATICVLESGDIEIKQQKTQVMRRLIAAFGATHD